MSDGRTFEEGDWIIRYVTPPIEKMSRMNVRKKFWRNRFEQLNEDQARFLLTVFDNHQARLSRWIAILKERQRELNTIDIEKMD